MKICNNCEGLIPEKLNRCPNCDFNAIDSQYLKRNFKKVINGITISSVAMTLMACYGQPPCRPKDECDRNTIINYLLITNSPRYVTIQITGSKDLGTLKVYIQGNEIIVQDSQKSIPVKVYNYPGVYKIVDSYGKTIFKVENFDFSGNIKDGTLIKEDTYFDFSNQNNCYNLNGTTGKAESISCDI